MWCIRCSSFSRSFRSLLRGLNPEGMIAVGMIGFEPTTPSSRTRCATKLRYIPSFGLISIPCKVFGLVWDILKGGFGGGDNRSDELSTGLGDRSLNSMYPENG
jgi:hypothetical protein